MLIGTMKRILMMTMLLVPVLAFAQDKELVVWHSYRGKEKDAILQVVEAFNKQADGYKFKALAIPYDAYADKVTAAVPRGKGPDVFIFAQDRLGGWIEAGNTVEPLDFFLDEEVTEQFIPSTMAAMTYRDQVYGLPLNYKMVTMIYNKALVKKVPETTAELVAFAKANTDAQAGKFGLAYAYSDFFYHSALMNAFGGRVFDPGPVPALNCEENVKSFEYLLGWLNDDKILPEEPSTALITSLFNKGDAAIVFNGPWFLGEIDASIDYGLAPLPKVSEANNEPMRPWMTVEGVYIAAPSENKDEAFEFVKFITGVNAGKMMAKTGRQTPANQGVYDDAEIKNDAVLNAIRNQAKTAVPMPNVPEMTMVWSPATTAMNLTVKGASKPKDALTEAQKKVSEDVARLRKSN